DRRIAVSDERGFHGQRGGSRERGKWSAIHGIEASVRPRFGIRSDELGTDRGAPRAEAPGGRGNDEYREKRRQDEPTAAYLQGPRFRAASIARWQTEKERERGA